MIAPTWIRRHGAEYAHTEGGLLCRQPDGRVYFRATPKHYDLAAARLPTSGWREVDRKTVERIETVAAAVRAMREGARGVQAPAMRESMPARETPAPQEGTK